MYWIKKATPLLAFGIVGLISAQAVFADSRPHASNAEVREAYYGSPLITNREARSVPLGITPAQLVKRFHGRSFNAQNYAHGRFWQICITYPVRDTGVRDPQLGVIADEWLFCFVSKTGLTRKFFWDS